MAAGIKTGGRKKGSKNKEKPVGKGGADKAALVLTPTVSRRIVRTKGSTAPAAARDGIGALALLEESMRSAWECAHIKAHEAEDLDSEAVGVRAMVADAADDLARAQLIERAGAIEQRAIKLKIEAGQHISHATQLAKDVAPYRHARLTNVDGSFKAKIEVIRATF